MGSLIAYGCGVRPARDFFRPLAVGAPEPVREIPFPPSRMIHFFPAANEKMRSKVPDIAPTVSSNSTTANCPFRRDGRLHQGSDPRCTRHGLVGVGRQIYG